MVDGKNLRYTKIALNNRDVRKILTDESTGDGNRLNPPVKVVARS
jgi:hypothetical protein